MPPVNDTQLTDLATAKVWLRIAAADITADSAITRLILVATTTVKQATNRPKFITQTVTERYSGLNGLHLFLNLQPVTAVLSVIENGTRTLLYNNPTYQGGYIFDKYGLIGLSERFYSNSIYDVTYTGGFALNSEEALLAEQAVLSLCNLWWKRAPHQDEITRNLGQQVSVKYTLDELPPETNAIIKQLKRVA